MRLRELRREDLATLNSWRNDRDVVAGLGANFVFVGPEVDASWFQSYMESRDRNIRLAILDEDGEFVGCAYLLGISWLNRSAEFSIMIGRKDRWNRGIGTAAAQGVLDHAFQDLQLHRVWLHVNRSNEGARRMYDRVGFKHEGTLRAAVFKSGTYSDVDVMAILSDDHRRRRLEQNAKESGPG